MFDIGMSELIVILIITLLVFGPKKLPEIARFIGRGIYKLKQEVHNFKETIDIEEPFPKEAPNKPISDKKKELYLII